MENVWKTLSQEPKAPVGVLTDAFVSKYHQKLDWELLSIHYDFSMEMLRTYQGRVAWQYVLKRTKFPEHFLREMAGWFDNPNLTQPGKAWNAVCKYQQLSESFISLYAHNMNWDYVKRFQNVSRIFLDQHRWRFANDDEDLVVIN